MNLPKSLKSYNINNRDVSYANSSLQAFIQLDCVQEWMKYLIKSSLINNQFYESTTTKDLSIQLKNISNGLNPDTSQIILGFEKKFLIMWRKNIEQDPYHFLNYFLRIIHCENNIQKNPNFDMGLYYQKMREKISSDIDMFSLFNNYLDQTQNSFISDNFYNIQKYHVNCPLCLSMFNYGEKIIIKFNLDQVKKTRKDLEPLIDNNKRLSLNDCFLYSSKQNKINCQFCKQSFAFEFTKIYNSAQVLIIAFNRNNKNPKYQNDVGFYPEFDISKFIINSNCLNKKYKLKSVICKYGENKYFSDVFINPNFYRFMDCKMGKDVKMIKNINELVKFEPQILFYEVDYQNKMLEKMRNMSANQNVVNNVDISSTMQINLELINKMPRGFKMYKVINYFTLIFQVIPQIWDSSKESAITINAQVSDDFTLKEAINRFFIKLQKPREAIIKFCINNMQLDPNSEQKLKDMNINENTIIYALKSQNFDQLSLNND